MGGNEATELISRAIEAANRVFGKNHPDTLQIQLDQGLILLIQQRHGEAEELKREIVDWYVATLGAGSKVCSIYHISVSLVSFSKPGLPTLSVPSSIS